jgi:hypothetical protein
MGRLRLSTLLALPVAITTSPLYAFPTSRLVYARGEGAESCPGEATARHAVVSRLGYDPFSLVADKTIVAEIVRDHDNVRGRMELVDEQGLIQGAREFRTSLRQCDDLVATMALAISIAIDPASESAPADSPRGSGSTASAPKAVPSKTVASQGTASEPASVSPAPSPAATEAQPPESTPSDPLIQAAADATPQPPPSTPANPGEAEPSHPPDKDHGSGQSTDVKAAGAIEFRAGAAVTTSFGAEPDAAMGLAASLGIRWNDFSLTVEGRGDWPASSQVPGGGAMRASLRAGSLLPCFHRGIWFVCGVAVIGSLHGSGQGLIVSHEDDAFYAAAGARVGAEVPLWGSLSFRPQLDGLANFSRIELRVDESEVWRATPLTMLVGAGIFASFP